MSLVIFIMGSLFLDTYRTINGLGPIELGKGAFGTLFIIFLLMDFLREK